MKKVVLLGDSIRMAYDKYVKDALEGKAEVFYPSENCRFTPYLLRYVHEWKKKGEWGDDVDVVHWNAGLWDVLDHFGSGPVVPMEFYADYVRRIDERLRLLFPKATIIFATTTTVLEHQYTGYSKRRNSQIKEYNDAAIAALEGTGALIDDLYSVTKDMGEEYYTDKTHPYTPEARAILGGKVLDCICPLLGITPSDINMESFIPEQYTKENIGY